MYGEFSKGICGVVLKVQELRHSINDVLKELSEETPKNVKCKYDFIKEYKKQFWKKIKVNPTNEVQASIFGLFVRKLGRKKPKEIMKFLNKSIKKSSEVFWEVVF